jgi:UDP-galactopyranose mutase
MSSNESHTADIICLSHLRWDFVFQRPQHLMTRAAAEGRVFFVEEPTPSNGTTLDYDIRLDGGVTVVVPRVPADFSRSQRIAAQRLLLDDLIASYRIRHYLLWYYTPMALPFTDHLTPEALVYDCMDELSAFKGAPTELSALEQQLMRRATLVLTGGRSLYEAKRGRHPRLYAVPSSVDAAHFAQARHSVDEPADQQAIDRPRLGFFGVIDERMDLALLDGVAVTRPDWQLVMVGPVVKIDPALLPRRPNIHYLGPKSYAELPHYIAGWDLALLPFARNESTRFISPTKTPEYLAAGRHVVSTPIDDVVTPYGDLGLVRIADDVPSFVEACAMAMVEPAGPRQARADAFLARTSWDATWRTVRSYLDAATAATMPNLESTPRSDLGAPSYPRSL